MPNILGTLHRKQGAGSDPALRGSGEASIPKRPSSFVKICDMGKSIAEPFGSLGETLSPYNKGEK